MSAGDWPIWERFKVKYSDQFQGYYYDVALGTPAPVPPDVESGLVQMWERLTVYRIDAVGVRGDEWWIIEVRPDAGPGALGALMTYGTLWDIEAKELPQKRLVLVTDQLRPDIQKAAIWQGFLYLVV